MNDVRRHQSHEAAEIFSLIAQGRLPAAAALCTVDEEPAWTLTGIAAVIGISRDALLDHLRQGPPRFAVDPGKREMGENRLLAK